MICSAGFIYDDAILLTNLNLAKQARREFIGNLNQMLFIARKCATRRFSVNIAKADLKNAIFELSRHSFVTSKLSPQTVTIVALLYANCRIHDFVEFCFKF